MFTKWKERQEEKKAKNKAIAESQYWKNHPLLRTCLQAMRGSCTVAPMELHEAAIAVVNIALREDTWTSTSQVSEQFLAQNIYIVWDNEKIPVLKAPRELAIENLPAITAVAAKTFLVSETLDRIIWLDANGHIQLYSIA